jgi:hypothetical protein
MKQRTHMRTGFRRGELMLHRAVKAACDELGEQNPFVQECIQILLRLSKTEAGRAGRHVGARMRAATFILDQLRRDIDS